MPSRFANIFVERKRKEGDKVYIGGDIFLFPVCFIKFVTTQRIDFRVWTCSSYMSSLQIDWVYVIGKGIVIVKVIYCT